MNIQPSAATPPPPGHTVIASTPRETNVRLAVEQTASKATDPATANPRLQQADRKQVETAAQSVREFVQPINSNLEFSVDDDTGQLVVKIIDRTTQEVIRQMPSEEMLAIARALDSIKGLFVQQTA